MSFYDNLQKKIVNENEVERTFILFSKRKFSSLQQMNEPTTGISRDVAAWWTSKLIAPLFQSRVCY